MQLYAEYDGEGALCHVKIMKWPTSYSFYAHFAEMAEKLWRKKAPRCDSVPFYSFMPQYDQMTTGQLMFYLYWRDRVRHGEYPHADYSYILLYLYEIMNLPDLISPATGASFIAHAWVEYRPTYPHLDKYAGEWLIDYCLIRKTPVPYDVIAPILPDAVKNLSLPELYVDMKNAGFEIMRSCSAYDHEKSKYYADNKDVFDEHIKKAARIGAAAYFGGDVCENIRPVRVSRSTFSWAVVRSGVKFQTEITYKPFLKDRSVREVMTVIIKYCENNVRAALGIKSRFSKLTLPENVAQAIDGYFDAVFPDRYAKKKKQSDDEEYMKFYEPDASGADIDRAMQIERDAWQTAIELDAENIAFEEDDALLPIAEDAAEGGADGDCFSAFVSALPPEMRAILSSAADGTFGKTCASFGVPPTEAERIINEIAFDTTGDAVLSGGKMIDDYSDEIIEALSKNGE